MNGREPVVSVSGVTKTFPQGNVTALQDIDLHLEAGDFVSLIGPSGCGKSTLLRVIGDLVEPTTGTVTVNGKSARQARDEDAWNFARTGAQPGLRERVERELQATLRMRSDRLGLLKRTIADWSRPPLLKRAVDLRQPTGISQQRQRRAV